MATLKDRILAYCETNNTSQAKLAKELDFGYNYFNLMVNGRKEPSARFLAAIEALIPGTIENLPITVVVPRSETIEKIVELAQEQPTVENQQKDQKHEISIGGAKVDVFNLQKRNTGKMSRR